MNTTQQAVLVGAYRDLDYWRDPERTEEMIGVSMGNSQSPERRDYGRTMLAIRAAKEGFVRIDLAKWIGHGMTESQRVMAGRALRRLESDGLIELYALAGFGERKTHLAFTKRGEELARELAAKSPEAADA
jgi:hypothetical protein